MQKTHEWDATLSSAAMGCERRSFSPVPPESRFKHERFVWIVAVCTLLIFCVLSRCHAADLQSPIPLQVQRPLAMEDWPSVLNNLKNNPLTNSVLRLIVVKALFETGQLPDEQFSWLHSSGPELLSTTELKQHAGSVHVAEVLLELGHLNAAERLAFNSLEMEGETPPVLRTLARLHWVKGLTNAASIFLNRLETCPEHSNWVAKFRADINANSPIAADPVISRIHTNLITRDGIVLELTTERLLRQALESNPANRMAFQFLMAHQLLDRQLIIARRTLATYPQVREGPLPRHYAEALLLLRQQRPELSLGSLMQRISPEVTARFQSFMEMMSRAAGSLDKVQPQAWQDFGNTYWYYFFFGSNHQPNRISKSDTP